MSKFTIEPLPMGFNGAGCTVARAHQPRSIIFIKLPDGQIFQCRPAAHPVNLIGEYTANEKDRSAYAKLAGIPVKVINAARRADRADSKARARNARLVYLKQQAQMLGFKLVQKEGKT